MQENHVRGAAQRNIPEHATRCCVDREQYAGIAGAQQPPLAGSRSSPCGPSAGTSYSFDILVGSRASMAMIRAGDAILTKNISSAAIVDRPTRAAGDFDFGDPLPASEVHDRYRMRIRNRGVADVRSDQDAAGGVEREPIRLHAYGDLESVPLGTRRKHRDGILASIGREDEPARFRHERTCHCREAGYRFNVSILRAVDHVDGIVAGMRDVEPIRGRMNIGVIEPAIGSMWPGARCDRVSEAPSLRASADQ